MNKAILMGRLTDNPDTHEANGNKVTKYTLAVDRRGEGADFIQCVTFGRGAEFAEKYLKKGMKIAATGRIQTGSYTNSEGRKVYTTDVIVEDHEFCERKRDNEDDGNPFV